MLIEDENEFSRLRFERPEEGILRIVLDGDGSANPIDTRMHSELVRVWESVDRDPATRAVVVQGADGVFSAGGDFDLISEGIADFDARLRLMREGRDLVYRILDFSKPVVSAIRGSAVGGGLAVALLADISVAGRDAVIFDGHPRVGIAAGDHAAIIWPLLCGMAKAKYHLLTSEPVSGEEAERIGLVSDCVDDADVEKTALKIACRLAEGSVTAISWTKLALNGWLRAAGPHFDASLALEVVGFAGPDVIEGLAALRENRQPKFR